ncbi:MAG: DUF456 domain-containing protein [Muribaculaceae bacterium]|nr:DUF456 domain-containing protein [Muribaculaceae bacterium]
MSTFCLIIGLLLIIGALVLAFRPVIPSVLLCYAAMWILDASNNIVVSSNSLMFWGMATLMVLLINMAQPAIRRNESGRGYVAVGTLAGAVVGMLMSHAGIIIGAALGASMGLVAYCCTPEGQVIQFPSREFVKRLASMGLPMIVAMSIFATILEKLLTNYIR